MSDPKIRIRRSSTPNKVPTITQLELGELAINTYDGKLYLEQDQGAAGVGNTVVRVNPWNVGLGTTAYNISFTSGKVGIGTTVAESALDVYGEASFSGLVGFGTNITLQDNGEIRLGERESGGSRTGDLIIRHDPSLYGNAFNVIQSNHGNLQIENRDTAGSTRFLYLKADKVQLRSYSTNESFIDTQVNEWVKLFYNNSEKLATTDTGIDVTGSVVSDGLTVDGYAVLDNISVSGITTVVGNLEIRPSNGQQTPRIYYDDSIAEALIFQDNVHARFGGSSDLRIYHDGDHSYVSDQGTGQLKILTSTLSVKDAGDNTLAIEAVPTTYVKLFYNGSNKLETTNTGITVTGTVVATGADINGDIDVDGHTNLDNVSISGVTTFTGVIDANNGIKITDSDNKSILLGESDDMRIRHTGSNSEITDEGAGSLRLGGNNVVIGSANFSETSAVFTQGAGVFLKYTNTARFATSGVGATVFGELDVTGPADIEGNLTVGVGGTTITTVVGAAASVCIGDASPSYMLDVAGAINSQTDVKVNGVSVTEQALNDAVAMAIALG